MTPSQSDRSRKWRASPKGKFAEQKRHARERGVAWELTYAQWWGVWTRSGNWAKRGNVRGKFCMCRKGDEGPYAIGNVYIGTWSQNTVERNRTVIAKRKALADAVGGTPCTGDEVPF